ncbi:MAG: 2Fe-2S iron-sulfur cluster-binding protein [Gammaproteobacteria bacterium]|jgi:CDP-4-dehydro-6-deoxyglucose reductase
MPRLITLSRAARLVGVKRGALQNKIQQGELRSFDGEILLSDLLQAYPQTRVGDSTMLERVEQIMEQAVNKIIRPEEEIPEASALAARIMGLSEELATARHETRRLAGVINGLQAQFDALSTAGTPPGEAFVKLKEWFGHALAETAAEEDSDDFIAREAFLRVMAAQVRILPSGHEFLIEGNDSILEAGLRSGLALNYGCSNGNCGLCKCKVVSGQTKKIAPHDYVLTEAEKGLGYILACSSTAVTDVVLEADEALGSNDIPAQEIDIKVKKIERPDDRIVIVNARTPRTKRLRFLAGQYLSVELDDLAPQHCAIASCPCDDMNLQLHIPVIAGNRFSEILANETRPAAEIRIRGPLGDFTLNEDSPRSLVFIACDAGFGPIKSLVEHAMALDTAEDIHLYWITTPGNSHYLDNLCRAWSDALDNFHYTPLEATEPAAVETLLPGILETLHEADKLDFYVCMPGELLDGVENFLLDNRIPAAQLRLEPVR